MLKWILLVEGEETGQAAANAAWYFFKGSIGNKWYTVITFYQYSTTPVAVDLVSVAHPAFLGD